MKNEYAVLVAKWDKRTNNAKVLAKGLFDDLVSVGLTDDALIATYHAMENFYLSPYELQKLTGKRLVHSKDGSFELALV